MEKSRFPLCAPVRSARALEKASPCWDFLALVGKTHRGSKVQKFGLIAGSNRRNPLRQLQLHFRRRRGISGVSGLWYRRAIATAGALQQAGNKMLTAVERGECYT